MGLLFVSVHLKANTVACSTNVKLYLQMYVKFLLYYSEADVLSLIHVYHDYIFCVRCMK